MGRKRNASSHSSYTKLIGFFNECCLVPKKIYFHFHYYYKTPYIYRPDYIVLFVSRQCFSNLFMESFFSMKRFCVHGTLKDWSRLVTGGGDWDWSWGEVIAHVRLRTHPPVESPGLTSRHSGAPLRGTLAGAPTLEICAITGLWQKVLLDVERGQKTSHGSFPSVSLWVCALWKKNKNKKRSPKYCPVAWPQDAAAQRASSRSLENPFFSQRVFGF